MIYHLFQYLKDFDFPGHGLMNYLSVRAILAFSAALLLALTAGKKTISLLQKKQIGESIRDLGLEGQMQKKGTPTMGGVIILFSIVIPVLLLCNLTSVYVQLLLFTTLWCGGIGFADDYIKVFKHNKEGLSERKKLILQVILGLIVGLTVCYSNDIVVREKSSEDTELVTRDEAPQSIDTQRQVTKGQWKSQDVVKSTKTTLPFVKNHEFDYKFLSPLKGKWGWYLKWAIYVIMIVFVVTACSNGTNLTDGIDGLAAGSSAIVGSVIGVLAWLSGNIVNSGYLNIMYIPGTGEVAIVMAAFVGALIGFLWYNSYPAQVFMGDTGSLAIGGIIGVSAILIRKELLLPLLCGIFFVESISVLMQRAYFKHTKKKYGQGRRILKMSPLHHHFQKEGIEALIQNPVRAHHEVKITNRFLIVGLLLGVATLALLKIR